MKEKKVTKSVTLFEYSLTLAFVTQMLRGISGSDAQKIVRAVAVQFGVKVQDA